MNASVVNFFAAYVFYYHSTILGVKVSSKVLIATIRDYLL
jgi:hypothetical protein